jgi:hypothetical protein
MTDPAAAALARHAIAVATVRDFASRSGAHRVVLLLDEGDERPATMLELVHGAPLELTEAGVTHAIADGVGIDASPLPLRELRPAPATWLQVDPVTGELAAPPGVVANLGEAVLGLAAAFGGRSVATADFSTRDAGRPLTIAARQGEPIVLAVGEEQFMLR